MSSVLDIEFEYFILEFLAEKINGKQISLGLLVSLICQIKPEVSKKDINRVSF